MKRNPKAKKQKHKRTQREHVPEVVETKDFAAKIILKDGKKTLQISSQSYYQHQINKFREGEVVTAYISSRKPKRTIQQNRYYWGVYLPLIAEETGERNLDRLHKLFTGKFLTEEIIEVLGERVRMVKSTTTLSKSQFSEYIMAIEAETGIEAPPAKNFFSED